MRERDLALFVPEIGALFPPDGGFQRCRLLTEPVAEHVADVVHRVAVVLRRLLLKGAHRIGVLFVLDLSDAVGNACRSRRGAEGHEPGTHHGAEGCPKEKRLDHQGSPKNIRAWGKS